jgi:hypothetical protein
MRYQVNVTKRGKTTVSEPMESYGAALTMAQAAAKGGAKVVTITRDDEGADHPDNAGKFFLHRIIK